VNQQDDALLPAKAAVGRLVGVDQGALTADEDSLLDTSQTKDCSRRGEGDGCTGRNRTGLSAAR
jgi:hypothetical protein